MSNDTLIDKKFNNNIIMVNPIYINFWFFLKDSGSAVINH